MWRDSRSWFQDVAQHVDILTIDQLLVLHDWFLGPLPPATKRRLVLAAAPPSAAPDPDVTLSVAA